MMTPIRLIGWFTLHVYKCLEQDADALAFSERAKVEIGYDRALEDLAVFIVDTVLRPSADVLAKQLTVANEDQEVMDKVIERLLLKAEEMRPWCLAELGEKLINHHLMNHERTKRTKRVGGVAVRD